MQEMTRYLESRQSIERPPTAYEDMLGDAIERAFGAGIYDLPGLVAYLNGIGLATPAGEPWTETNYQTEIAILGA